MADFTSYRERRDRLRELREREHLERRLFGRWGPSKRPAYMSSPVQQQMRLSAQAAMLEERRRREAEFDAEVLAMMKLRGL